MTWTQTIFSWFGLLVCVCVALIALTLVTLWVWEYLSEKIDKAADTRARMRLARNLRDDSSHFSRESPETKLALQMLAKRLRWDSDQDTATLAMHWRSKVSEMGGGAKAVAKEPKTAPGPDVEKFQRTQDQKILGYLNDLLSERDEERSALNREDLISGANRRGILDGELAASVAHLFGLGSGGQREQVGVVVSFRRPGNTPQATGTTTETTFHPEDFAEKGPSGKVKIGSFEAGTGWLGTTEPGQVVTPENVSELPPGSVVKNGDGSRIIHLHDGLWLWCRDGAHVYDRVKHLLNRLDEKSVACHVAPGEGVSLDDMKVLVRCLEDVENGNDPEGTAQLLLDRFREKDPQLSAFAEAEYKAGRGPRQAEPTPDNADHTSDTAKSPSDEPA